MAGKLSWGTIASFGKIGRSFLRPFFTRQHDTGPGPCRLSGPLSRAIHWWLEALPAWIPRRVPRVPVTKKGLLVYTDAAGP